MQEADAKKDGNAKGGSKESTDEKPTPAAAVVPEQGKSAMEAEKTESPKKSETSEKPTPAAQASSDGAEEKEEEEESSMEDLVSGMASAASGWLSGWMKSLEVAKYKSAEVYDMVKKDLTEFSEAVQTETSTMLSETSSLLSSTSQTLKQSLQATQSEASTAGQVKKSVSGFLTHVHKVFTPDTAQDDDAEAYVLQDGQPVLLDRLQTELYRLSSDAATFLTEPAESERVRYEVWSADLDLEARQTELSDLLASNRTLLHQYTQLVPAQVSHVLFWHRYLFRVHLAEEKEKQREQLRKRADQMSSPGQAEKQITWEEDSEKTQDFSHHVEVTDAQADQLLAEYEAEVKQKPKKDSAATPSATAAEGQDRPASRSPERAASSNEDDWVKADMDTETNSSVGNDWEKWD